MALSEYDILYVNQTAVKGSALADQLAYHPLADSQPLSYEFPDEHLMAATVDKDQRNDEWTMWFDGASNIVGNGIRVLLVLPENQCLPFAAKLGFDCTNNMAEYEACTMGLLMALEHQVKRLRVFGDSALVIYQLRGEWEARDAKLIPYHDYAKEIMSAFEAITFSHVHREENQTADALATLSAMVRINEGQEMVIQVRQQPQTAYCQCLPVRRQYQMQNHGKYPEDAPENSKRTLRRLASNFLLSGTTLYKRNSDMTLLRCVDEQEAKQIIEEVHEGIFGTHVNGHALARKILRAGYYWTQMESDCHLHVQKCAKCQMYTNHLNVAPSTLHNLNAPWPFSMWGIDVIGPIEPKASNGHRFILVAIDYFTKWVEASSYSSVPRRTVIRFIKRDIICRYGLPAHIITDNGTNLNNKMMSELCEQFRITHHNSTPYRPKMNGAVEAANKNLKKIIQKMVVTYKDWHEMLPYALHGYHTSVRTSTGASPYLLVYGTEAVLPIEVEIPSLRVLAEAELDETEWVQQRFDQLNLIEEKRLTALCHGQLYQQRIKRAFDKKVKPRVFQKGDMVLKKVLPNIKDQRGKWAPNYEGPYVVKQAFSGGALILIDAEGQDLSHPVNADAKTRRKTKTLARTAEDQGKNTSNPLGPEGLAPQLELYPLTLPKMQNSPKKNPRSPNLLSRIQGGRVSHGSQGPSLSRIPGAESLTDPRGPSLSRTQRPSLSRIQGPSLSYPKTQGPSHPYHAFRLKSARPRFTHMPHPYPSLFEAPTTQAKQRPPSYDSNQRQC
ncbi:Gypsy retrotransposon integrase-like protein 1, partial [Mucuna pruriens]